MRDLYYIPTRRKSGSALRTKLERALPLWSWSAEYTNSHRSVTHLLHGVRDIDGWSNLRATIDYRRMKWFLFVTDIRDNKATEGCLSGGTWERSRPGWLADQIRCRVDDYNRRLK